MASYQELMDAARRADAAGDSNSASRLVNMARQAQNSEQPEEIYKPSTVPVVSPETMSGIKGEIATTIDKAGEAISTIPTGIMRAATGGETETLGKGLSALGYATGVSNPNFQRMAPAIATSLLTKNLQPAVQALSAAASSFLGSKIAGDTNSEAIRNASYNLATMGPVKESGKFFKPAFLTALKDISQIGIAGTGGQYLAKAVEAGNIMPYKTIGEFGDDMMKSAPAAAVGIITGPLRAGVAKNNYNQRAIEEVRNDITKALGEQNITIGMLLPEQWASVEANMAQNNPALAAKINSIGNSALDRFSKIVPKELQTDAEIATNLNMFTSAIQKENSTLDRLRSASASAEKAADIAATLGISETEISKLRSSALAAKMAEVNQAARISYWKDLSARTTGTLKPISDSMNEFQQNIDSIFKIRSGQAEEAYKATGVPLTEAFIPKADLITAVKDKLSQRSSVYRDKVISAIENIDGKDTTSISINQMREIRSNIADAFIGADPKQLSAIESIADEAYTAITAKTASLVKSTYGEGPAKALADVNSWWGRAANAKNSRYARPLVSGEMQETIPERLASQVSRGEFQGVKDYFSFIDTVAELAPDVADSGRASVYSAIRDGFIANAAKGSDRINFDSLTKSLGALSARSGKDFNVSSLGFGTPQQLAAMNRALIDFNPSGVVSSSVLDEFYRNPIVQKQLLSGSTDKLEGIARVAAAKNAFDNLAETQFMADKLGVTLKLRDLEAVKAGYARQANLDVDAQAARIAEMQKKPIYEVLSRKAAGIPTDIGAEAGSISKTIRNMRPMDRADFMSALNKDYPVLSKQVQERFAADAISDWIIPDSTNKNNNLYALDAESVRRFFAPSMDRRSSSVYQLQQVLSPEAFDTMKKTLPALARLTQYAREGGFSNANKELFDAMGISFAASQNRAGATAGYSSLFARIGNLINEGRYKLVSKIVTDKKFSNAYFAANGSFDAALNSLRVPQAMMLKIDAELRDEAASVEKK